MIRLAIISDTHMPKGGRRLPSDCLELLTAADLIVHAGDLCTLDVLEELEAINPVVAVHGNVDDHEVTARLPETAIVPLDQGVRAADDPGAALAVVHDAGPARGRMERLRRRFPESRAVIFGHSHLPLHEGAADGFQIFNPGSPTERRRAPRHTMGLGRIEAGRVEFELVELTP